MMRIRVIVGSIICACVSLAYLFVVYAEKETRFSSRAERKAANLSREIKAEIKELSDHPWAGVYYEGDGLGANNSLVLAPKAGYVFGSSGCTGDYDRNYGGVSFTNDRIQLSFTFPNDEEGFQGISPVFLPVSWGTRKYLIPPNDLISFCNSINAGAEPRDDVYGRHLLRCGDEKKSVGGFPTLPVEFEPYLKEEPIIAEIVATGAPQMRPSVCDWKFKDTPVTLKGGRDVGLLRGMELFVTSPVNVVPSVQIREVNEDTAEGVMTDIGETRPGPQVGWKLSTRPRWVHNRNPDTTGMDR